jgi:uncharacterized protein YndB with AHSA1/START domain
MQKIKVEILVNSNINKVWECWNNPKDIKGWAFASDDWECPYAENDFKIGGRFLNKMKAKDNSVGFDFTGTYTEIIELQKIKYEMDTLDEKDEARECEIFFTDLGNNTTKIEEVFDSENVNDLEMQKNGKGAV